MLRLAKEDEKMVKSSLCLVYDHAGNATFSRTQMYTATLLFSVMRNRFNDEDLPELIAAAKTVETTKEVAAKLEYSL